MTQPAPRSNRPTEEGARLRTLIRDLAATPKGFTREDAAGLQIHRSLISKRCNSMVRAGVIFPAKVRGQSLRFFSSEAAVQQWKAAQPPYKKPRKVHTAKAPGPISHTAKSQILIDVITAKAATPEGFTVSDAPDCVRRTSVWHRCAEMTHAGQLFVVYVEHRTAKYFTTQAAADVCRAAFMDRQRAKALIVKAERIYPPTKAKQARPPVERKPWVAPVKTVATIIYPPGYKHSVSLMPMQRNRVIDVPFFHGGMRAMAC